MGHGDTDVRCRNPLCHMQRRHAGRRRGWEWLQHREQRLRRQGLDHMRRARQQREQHDRQVQTQGQRHREGTGRVRRAFERTRDCQRRHEPPPCSEERGQERRGATPRSDFTLRFCRESDKCRHRHAWRLSRVASPSVATVTIAFSTPPEQRPMQTNEDTMRPARRRFLQTAALGAAALPVAMLGSHALAAEASGRDPKLPKSILALQPVASKVVPIGDDERRARMARAQQLMDKHGIDAIFVDAGTTLDYFAGLRWWNSERTMGMLLPKSGDPVYIVPAFERSRTQGQIRIGSDVRTWQENESPYALIANVMREHHAGTGVLE